MQYEWLKKLPNLEIVVDYIEEFFRKKNFAVETIPQDAKTKIRILALPTEKSEIGQLIRIEVSETLKGTSVDFMPTSRADESIRLGILTQMMFGGLLMAKSANTKEKLDALETEFWNNLQEFIASQHGQVT
jgi:hypothetical protein